MNILIVDDTPKFKVDNAIEYLKSQNVNFTYEITESCCSGLRYLRNHSNEIDLIIVDLGLPFYDNGSNYDELNGLRIISEIDRLDLNIPIIINSTTKIPNEEQYLKLLRDCGLIIEHVEELYGGCLYDFIHKLLTK